MSSGRTEPYRTTPIFDHETLPAALRHEHSTKADVWGLLRVLQGEVRLVFADPPRELQVTPDRPAEIPPEAVHHVELVGPMRMQVEFYRARPVS